ncbi:uncharacterized protein LOC128425457 isoform X1 [Pleuronectes platessa]|uniref:uncharacterized protein LOC128425457 isoform X1 n=1 Tax=Pleuronectes platessa TaxID=8262 RepID=UPI00232A3843|nr:uncharacterized protein LOC128425457 isoform X1 [Pleuronectes platessa]
MSKNDFCRCCKKYLRIHGQLSNTNNLFERNGKDESTYEKVLRLGLRLQITSKRSCRICRSCKNLITRLERDLPVFKKWTDDEGDRAEEACPSGASQERDRGPRPSMTPGALKKFCPDPSTPTGTTTRGSITEVVTHYPSQTVAKMSSEPPLVGGGAAGKATSSSVVAGDRKWDGGGGMDQINVVRIDDTHIAEEPSDLGGKVKGEAVDYYEVEYSIPEGDEEAEEEAEEEDSLYVIEYSNPEEEGDSYQFTMSVDRSLSDKRPVKHPVVKENATAPSAMTSRTQGSSRQTANQKRKRRTEEEEGAIRGRGALRGRQRCEGVGERTAAVPAAQKTSVLAIHLKQMHQMEGRWKFFCTSCKQAVPSQTELDAHRRRHTNEDVVFSCSLCPETPGAGAPGRHPSLQHM